MKLLCSNVHGLGSLRAVCQLQHVLKLHKPYLVFLMETKIDNCKMEKVRQRCDFLIGFYVSEIRSRGLNLAWIDEIQVTL